MFETSDEMEGWLDPGPSAPGVGPRRYPLDRSSVDHRVGTSEGLGRTVLDFFRGWTTPDRMGGVDHPPEGIEDFEGVFRKSGGRMEVFRGLCRMARVFTGIDCLGTG